MTRPADLVDRRVVVWGWGVEGRAAARLLRSHYPPASLDVVDDRPAPPGEAGEGIGFPQGMDARRALERCEVIVKSPGVSPYRPDVAAAAAGRVLTGGTALWFAETGGEHTVAVTGSKGKSTTASLVGHLLDAVGTPCRVAGNVGRAVLDLLADDLDAGGTDPGAWNVLELSSFQTAEVAHSPVVGVLTALFPEHLDWHGDVDRYYADKCNLFLHRPGIVTVANAANRDVAARMASLPNCVPYGLPRGIHPDGAVLRDGAHELFPLDASPLLGGHNAMNLAGALTALRAMGVDIRAEADRLAGALAGFRPLRHRLEPVGEVDGRLVVDDGLSTAPQAAVAALAAFDGRAVTILVGGHDRGLDYGALAAALAARRAPATVLAVPESGPRVAAEIERAVAAAGNGLVRVERFDDFDDAVARALAVTPRGGVILLSPAAPSFGRFANYAERSAHFRRLVGLA